MNGWYCARATSGAGAVEQLVIEQEFEAAELAEAYQAAGRGRRAAALAVVTADARADEVRPAVAAALQSIRGRWPQEGALKRIATNTSCCPVNSPTVIIRYTAPPHRK